MGNSPWGCIESDMAEHLSTQHMLKQILKLYFLYPDTTSLMFNGWFCFVPQSLILKCPNFKELFSLLSGSISVWGNKIPHAMWHTHKKKEKKEITQCVSIYERLYQQYTHLSLGSDIRNISMIYEVKRKC